MKKKLTFSEAEKLSSLTEVGRLERGVIEGPYADLGYHGERRVRALAKSLGQDEDAHVEDAERQLGQQRVLHGERRYIHEQRDGYFNNITTYEISFDNRDFSCYCYVDSERAKELLPKAIAVEAARSTCEEAIAQHAKQATPKKEIGRAQRKRANRLNRYETDPEFKARCDSFGTKP